MKKIIFFIFIVFILSSTSFAADLKVYFSPKGGCQETVISQIKKAQRTIDIAMYDFTSGAIAQELIKARGRNVLIRIVLDKSQAIQYSSKAKYLTKNHFGIRYHNGHGLMHNKFAIIDGRVLITGSFNWTMMADQRNEENLLVITDAGLIKEYQKRFEYLYRSSTKKESVLKNSTTTYPKNDYNSHNYSVRFFR